MRRSVLQLVLPLVLLLSACAGGEPPDGSPDTPEPLPIPSATGAAPPPGSDPLGLKWNRYQPQTADFIRRTAGGWTFTEIEWCEVEPSPGQRDWSTLDEAVSSIRDLGHEPMIKIRTGQCWGTAAPLTGGFDRTEATFKTPSTPPTDLPAYLAFVTDLVHRYAALGVHEYAVENEVDVTNFWAAEVAEYDRLVRQVAPAIREADPEARVLDGGVSSTSYGVALAAAQLATGDEEGALATYQRYYSRRIQGGVSRWPRVSSVGSLQGQVASEMGQRSVQAVDLAIRLATEGIVDVYQLHFYETVEALPQLLTFLTDRIGGAVPIEAWEAGVAWPGSDYDQRAQAEEVYRLVALLLARNIRRIVYLPVAYTPGDRTQVFRGLVLHDGTPLVAGHAWVALTDALAGLEDGTLTPLTGDLSGVTWSGPGGDGAIVWATGEPAALPGDGVARVLDAAGAEIDAGRRVDDTPVLVLGSEGQDLAAALGGG